jgi:hypothetical protein
MLPDIAPDPKDTMTTDEDGGTIDVVFDGPPGPDGPRFVEVETPDGKSARRGEWLQREDGYWVLRIEDPAALRADLDATKEAIRTYLDEPYDTKDLRDASY